MMATSDWSTIDQTRDFSPAGLVAISGLFDLHPVRLSSRNDYLHLDAAAERRNSPIDYVSRLTGPAIIACGDKELDEFQRQSKDFAAALMQQNKQVVHVVESGLNHFDMSLEFYRPGSKLCDAVLKLITAERPQTA